MFDYLGNLSMYVMVVGVWSLGHNVLFLSIRYVCRRFVLVSDLGFEYVCILLP